MAQRLGDGDGEVHSLGANSPVCSLLGKAGFFAKDGICILVCTPSILNGAKSYTRCRFQRGDVELSHLHHGGLDAGGGVAVGRGQKLRQTPRHDLPGDAEAIA